jgi:glycosyltransferase involved in cell wall biosynthesis
MDHDALTIGIVTISYNQARFLPETIDSVRVRDLGRLRYVIVDPGSTDGSRETILGCRDRFSAVVLERDQGPADGLNRGFARCDADVLGFLNSDDRFCPGALDFVLDYFEHHPEVDVLMGAARFIDADGRLFRRRAIVPWRFSARRFAQQSCTFAQQGTFFRRRVWEQVGGFNVANRSCWDAELFVDMDLAGARFQTVRKILADFRIHSESLSGGKKEIIKKQYHEDLAKLWNKIIEAGIRPSPAPAKWVSQAVFRIHPVRRAMEWLVR